MLYFLHTFQPSAVLFSLGPIQIYWYGFFIVLGIIIALLIAFQLAKYYQIKPNVVFDLVFWLIIGGIIGARLYDVGLQFHYYLDHPEQIIKIWQGGLAIHGGIIGGIIVIYLFARHQKINFWKLAALVAPGLALAQALGRWGNYFNQELFGLPTNLSWGIPINILNRPLNYISNNYFHPTFLYESLGCLLIFLVLLIINIYHIKKSQLNNFFFAWSVALYMILYSILRFSLEFIRLDETPYFLGLRWPQIISLLIIIFGLLVIYYQYALVQKKKTS